MNQKMPISFGVSSKQLISFNCFFLNLSPLSLLHFLFSLMIELIIFLLKAYHGNHLVWLLLYLLWFLIHLLSHLIFAIPLVRMFATPLATTLFDFYRFPLTFPLYLRLPLFYHYHLHRNFRLLALHFILR